MTTNTSPLQPWASGGSQVLDAAFSDIKQRSFAHFSNLLDKPGAKDEASRDLRKTLLAFWRFGPEPAEDEDFGKPGQLWKRLPADTRVPDHSIWDHLDLTSAFAGAFAADPKGEAALPALSIGPVQPFIAAARTERLLLSVPPVTGSHPRAGAGGTGAVWRDVSARRGRFDNGLVHGVSTVSTGVRAPSSTNSRVRT